MRSFTEAGWNPGENTEQGMPQMAQKEDKKRGHTPKSKDAENYAKMEAIRTRIGMTESEFSIALGYVTSGGYKATTRNGMASLTLLLAAEGVERRYKPVTAPDAYLLVRVSSDGTVVTTPIDGEPQTANIMGQDFYLIPKK